MARPLYGKIWYRGIKPGVYSISELIKMTGSKYQYGYILTNLKRLGVEQMIPENRSRNQKLWIWKGDEFYIKQKIENDTI